MIDSKTYETFCKAPPSDLDDISAWRAFRDQMQPAMEKLNECLRVADEAELAQLRARAAQLESRLGSKPAPTATSIPSIPAARKPPNPVDETDWGMGVGGREKPMAAGDFREELASLKDRTTEKRQKRGAA